MQKPPLPHATPRQVSLIVAEMRRAGCPHGPPERGGACLRCRVIVTLADQLAEALGATVIAPSESGMAELGRRLCAALKRTPSDSYLRIDISKDEHMAGLYATDAERRAVDDGALSELLNDLAVALPSLFTHTGEETQTCA